MPSGGARGSKVPQALDAVANRKALSRTESEDTLSGSAGGGLQGWHGLAARLTKHKHGSVEEDGAVVVAPQRCPANLLNAAPLSLGNVLKVKEDAGGRGMEPTPARVC